MRYPESLKKGDLIGICAPSAGIVEEDKVEKLEQAISNLESLGYRVMETGSVRTCCRGRSASAKERAKEFMELMENDEVKLVLYATGGDFLMEMLDYLDFEKLKSLKPKWTQGFSDITTISFLMNTIVDVPSMYCETIKDYAMKPLYKNLEDSLKIMSGKKVVQTSFEKYEPLVGAGSVSEQENYTYNMTEDVKWENITNENEIIIKGRALGGCLDCLNTLIGTKYDQVKEYIKRYKSEGTIWFLECYEMDTPMLIRSLWKMKNAGYFENCSGVIFGRSYIMREDYGISFNEAVLDAIGDLQIPIITNADIGHLPPQLAIVNGAVLKITSKDGKGVVETFFK